MGHHCCSKQKVKRGLWSPEEDDRLIRYITSHGHGCWSSVPKQAGLQRCGKSCRLRWINYLKPDLKRGSFSEQEERIIIDVHRILGNRWAQIAKHLPGRTDNEVKNFWNSCIKKKLIAQGLDPKTHNLIPTSRHSNAISSSNHSQFHHSQTSATPFTISSHIKSFETTKNNSMDMNQLPFLTPSPSHPNLSLHETIPISTYQYQDQKVFMSFNDQNSHTSMDYTNGSLSLDLTNVSSSFNQTTFIDEACIWTSTANTVDAPKQVEEEPQPDSGQQQLQHPMSNVNFNDDNEEKDLDIETSYNSAAFDLELMESALMPCGVFCSGSALEHLPWDC